MLRDFNIAGMFRTDQEVLEPKEFLDRLPEIRDKISSAIPVAASLGAPGFGRIVIKYRRPESRFPSIFSGKPNRYRYRRKRDRYWRRGRGASVSSSAKHLQTGR